MSAPNVPHRTLRGIVHALLRELDRTQLPPDRNRARLTPKEA